MENYKNKDLVCILLIVVVTLVFLDICSITFIMENEVLNTALELPSVNDLT